MSNPILTDLQKCVSNDLVLIAIKRGSVMPHVGILHRNGVDDSFEFCHLAFHYCFRNVEADTTYKVIETGLSEVEQVIFVSALRQIIDANGPDSLPYGFSDYTEAFDPTAGHYLLDKSGEGLTCATFILAVFAARGWLVVDRSAWPKRDDDEAVQLHLIEALRGLASEKYLENLLGFVGGPRIRPEETAFSCSEDSVSWPIGPDIALPGGGAVLQQL